MHRMQVLVVLHRARDVKRVGGIILAEGSAAKKLVLILFYQYELDS